MRDSLDKPGSSYAQVRLFPRKKEDENFQQFVYVNYTFEEFIFLLDVMIFVNDNVIAKKLNCNVL